ncbi:uncharacterized protein [Nicotiana tomentosiformis]|uniref:uncharacterized protein n=1 Tax=Nicotiana tomentosiformis TaxID=4098 RepID=UPI00388C9A5E
MDEEDAEKTAFITPWGIYCYKIMLFGLTIAGATYMRAMTTNFHEMIHREIELYVDDVIIKSKRISDHIADLKKFFDRLRKYNLKLNPTKCAFRVPAGKLLGFTINCRGIGAVLVSETGQHYPVSAKLRFLCTNNIAEYEACILGLRLAIDMDIQELLVIGDSDLLVHQVLGEWATKNTKIFPYLHCVQELIKRFTKIEFKHVPRIQNEFADTLATLSSMVQHPDKNFIDPIPIGIHKQPAYCAHVEEDIDRNPWFHDIKKYLEKGEYLESDAHTQKRTLRRLANHFFQSGGILYKRAPDLGLLRCIDAKVASRLLEKIHARTCGPHMNGFILAKKILTTGYFWMLMETNCIKYIQKCHQYQIYADMI